MVPKLEALAAMMLANPTAGQRELAQAMGVSVSWIWSVTRSDAFRALLAARSEDFYSEAMRSVKERMERVAETALDKLQERLEVSAVDTETVLNIGKAMLDRIGHGASSTHSIKMGGEVSVTHRTDLITGTRAALLQRNRIARLKSLGLEVEAEDGEVVETRLLEHEVTDGLSDELSPGGADRPRGAGDLPAELRQTEEGEGRPGAGAAV